MFTQFKSLVFHHSLKHPRLYSILRWVKYLSWRAKVALSGKGTNRKYDPDQLMQVSPASISLYIGGTIGNRFDTRGEVRDGNWDLNASSYQSWDIYESLQQRFMGSLSWEETEYYKRNVREIQAGKTIRGASSVRQFEENLSELEKLYIDIRDHGYLSQRDLTEKISASKGWEPLTKFSKYDDVTVAINRNGQFMLQDGKHRLAIAKALNLPNIPVAVGLRHAKWEKFKLELFDYDSDRGGLSYQPFTHPDLQDIAVQHDAPRELMIRDHMPAEAHSILDIGAYLGYFDLYFSALGYECTAIEHHPRHVYFIEKLSKAENIQFKVINISFLEWKGTHQYDVVLALNIFHHFLKTEALMTKLEARLRAIETNYIFLETHKQEDEIMQGVFRNFAPMEFAEYISRISGLLDIDEIGATSRGRKLFKISRAKSA